MQRQGVSELTYVMGTLTKAHTLSYYYFFCCFQSMASTFLRSPCNLIARAHTIRRLNILPCTTSVARRLESTYPSIKSCPSPTCSCAPTPPDPLIDRVSPISNTAPSYSQHVVLCTGHSGWTSRIEDEIPKDGSANLAAELKSLLGRGGKLQDVRLMCREVSKVAGAN